MKKQQKQMEVANHEVDIEKKYSSCIQVIYK